MPALRPSKSSTTPDPHMGRLPSITPGELLEEEFLRLPASRISEIIAGQRAITADTDLRLCRFLSLSPG
ncbi:MAG: hypothetical protein R6W06_14980 [Prochlorococcaceae cyanobacterium]